MNTIYDVAVVGAGIVGLSTALKLQEKGKKVLVLDKEKSPGLHQSGRNSGVIHSGIYYKPQSFKSDLCIRGRELLIDFMNNENIFHRIEGKIVVDNDIEKIITLNKRADELNMDGVRVLERNEILSFEPSCKFKFALYVPQAGVVDYKVVSETIAKKFQSLGGTIKYFQKINTINTENNLKVLTSDKETFKSEFLINCAGLFSDTVAKLDNIKPDLRIIPFRGEYYVLSQEKAHLVNNMIYPISDPNLPFLGIHLTKTVDGQIEAGQMLSWPSQKRDISGVTLMSLNS